MKKQKQIHPTQNPKPGTRNNYFIFLQAAAGCFLLSNANLLKN